MLSKENISPVAREIYPDINKHIREYYSFEFFGLKNKYSEYSFKKAILTNLKDFILEFGKDFLFIVEEYRLQVGDFKPEYMGKMDFYLGALDKNVKKSS